MRAPVVVKADPVCSFTPSGLGAQRVLDVIPTVLAPPFDLRGREILKSAGLRRRRLPLNALDDQRRDQCRFSFRRPMVDILRQYPALSSFIAN